MVRRKSALSNASRKVGSESDPESEGAESLRGGSLSRLLVRPGPRKIRAADFLGWSEVTKVGPAGRRPKSLERSSKKEKMLKQKTCFINMYKAVFKPWRYVKTSRVRFFASLRMT